MKITAVVTPAQAGVHLREEVDSRSPAFAEDKLRGNDEPGSDSQESEARNLALVRADGSGQAERDSSLRSE
jgi:hypothetical protein